ncbi:hypothetical protein SELMODRAFT_403987 [Selaginella moellendorffii]|uniref:Uncharacterized protein n=1 Tax=Selaginella moellendorffii TaxID=88036 RepID=D8QT75_SELML|nr:hypothetical protein SELMODRAFT_403987 [Selaginella moellendorffii]
MVRIQEQKCSRGKKSTVRRQHRVVKKTLARCCNLYELSEGYKMYSNVCIGSDSEVYYMVLAKDGGKTQIQGTPTGEGDVISCKCGHLIVIGVNVRISTFSTDPRGCWTCAQRCHRPREAQSGGEPLGEDGAEVRREEEAELRFKVAGLHLGQPGLYSDTAAAEMVHERSRVGREGEAALAPGGCWDLAPPALLLLLLLALKDLDPQGHSS